MTAHFTWFMSVDADNVVRAACWHAHDDEPLPAGAVPVDTFAASVDGDPGMTEADRAYWRDVIARLRAAQRQHWSQYPADHPEGVWA